MLRFKATCAMPLSFGEGSPRFVLGVTARTTQGTLAIDGVASLDGTFSLKRQSVPVHVLLPFTTEAPLGSLFQGAPLPQIAIKGASLKVEGDQTTLDGRLIFGADYVPTLRGTLALKHLSLPRWFGFARDLPPGVQVALDNISGTLPFELTPQKLVASSVTATTLNTVFTGGGGVNDFSNPVIALHLATKDAPLNRIFPEVENKAVSPEAKAAFIESMNEDARRYLDLVQKLEDGHTARLMAEGLPEKQARAKASKQANEDARFVLPNACETKMVVTMNARSLQNFFHLRCCNRAQWEIRQLAEEMLRLVYPVAPHIFRTAGPACVSGPCPEGKMCCGRTTEVRAQYAALKGEKAE